MSSTTTITCANHPDLPVASFCRTCGKALCTACRRPSGGTVYCAEHAPAASAPPPPPPPPKESSSGSSYSNPSYSNPANDNPYTSSSTRPIPHPMAGTHPAIAFGLGFIPGVGAIYNGQYAKGLVHAVVFGLLVTALSSGELRGFEPLLGILIAVFVFYMALEALHTARKREAGEPVEEFSSLVSGGEGGFPTGAVILIGLGCLLLVNTLGLISIGVVIRFWPVGLILIGAYMVYNRMRGGN